MIPFFARHPCARLTLLTKSAEVQNLLDLLDLEHNGHMILSWSLPSPPAIAEEFEPDTPSIEERLVAIEKCAAAGYPVRANLMPLIPADGWKDLYEGFIVHLTKRVPLARLTMGGVCSYKTARTLMNGKLGEGNVINQEMRASNGKPTDGRIRYSEDLRRELYSHLVGVIRKTPCRSPARTVPGGAQSLESHRTAKQPRSLQLPPLEGVMERETGSEPALHMHLSSENTDF